MSFDLKISQGDLVIGGDADLLKVENTEKLTQEILKIASTPLGGNPFQPSYGCLITRALIGNPLPMEFLSATASAQLSNSLTNLQKLQAAQVRYQPVTAAEQLAVVQQVKVERNQVDPRFFEVVIRVLAKDFSATTAQLSIGL